MRLTCPSFSSEYGLEDALIAAHCQELVRSEGELAGLEAAALRRTQGPGVSP